MKYINSGHSIVKIDKDLPYIIKSFSKNENEIDYFIKELAILKHLNISYLIEGNIHTYELKFKKYTCDLYKLKKNIGSKLTIYLKFILYDTLLDLKKCHSNNIIHRDIKLSNILCNLNTINDTDIDKVYLLEVKLCDYTLSKLVTKYDKSFTENVVTAYYKAPELLINLTDPKEEVIVKGEREDIFISYDSKIDIFALGILALELYDTNVELYYDRFKKGDIDIFNNKIDKILDDMINNNDLILRELIMNMINKDPTNRYNVDDCLNHKYFSELKDTFLYHHKENISVNIPFFLERKIYYNIREKNISVFKDFCKDYKLPRHIINNTIYYLDYLDSIDDLKYKGLVIIDNENYQLYVLFCLYISIVLYCEESLELLELYNKYGLYNNEHINKTNVIYYCSKVNSIDDKYLFSILNNIDNLYAYHSHI